MKSSPAAVSIYCFLLGASSAVILLLEFISEPLFRSYVSIIIYILPMNYILLNFAIHALTRKFLCQVGVRAAFLGFIFCLGLHVSALANETWDIFGWYLCFMAFFHYSEFLTIALTNPESLSISSFILNHSTEYKVAAVSSWIEFFFELWLYPGMKTFRYVSLLGLLMCLFGEGLRKLAMLTAKKNFNHIVQDEHKEGHSLVTTGVYSLFRHPSYVGWFYWSIGTQLILLNPFCIVAYTLASWKFFHDRVIIEEATLLSFFGEAYIDYQKSVPTGLPFINGFIDKWPCDE